jgi:glycosyltransferase involved in cell wall biosynthesis
MSLHGPPVYRSPLKDGGVCGTVNKTVGLVLRKEGWAHVYDEKDDNGLKDELQRLVEDKELRKKVAERAKQVCVDKHDNKKIRAAFHEALKNAV